MILVLKGSKTVVAAPGQTLLVNTTGNPGMATGGSGDVLAGMIASFIAQGMEPYRAAMCGVHLHGLAGDAAAHRLSQHAMLAFRFAGGSLGGCFCAWNKRGKPMAAPPPSGRRLIGSVSPAERERPTLCSRRNGVVL